MKTFTPFRFAAIALIATAIFTGCSSNSEKEAEAREEVQEAKEELQEVKQEANEDAAKAANAEEWQAFKADAELKIQENNARIAELREKMKKSGKTMDAMYEKRIENLQQKNNELKMKLDNYEKNQSDWEAFKAEFNHDMDELGKAFKDLTVDNK